VALLAEPAILASQAREFIGAVRAAALAGKRRVTKVLDLVLPFIEVVASQTQFSRDGCRRSSCRLPQSDGFQLELFGVLRSLRHRTPPGTYCPLFEVSTKMGLAQPVPFSLYCSRVHST